jgi:hypothetical protein
MIAPYKQKMWAVSDPFWGEPYLLPETFRESAPAAVKAFLSNVTWGIGHGGSAYPLPDGMPGDWDRAYANGYRLVRIEIDDSTINIVKETV